MLGLQKKTICFAIGTDADCGFDVSSVVVWLVRPCAKHTESVQRCKDILVEQTSPTI